MDESLKVNPRYVLALRILLVMVVGLMALGAGVRTMNAGLSCPDWPLCFGKVIPDFHPAVWFEFVHRAYAGLVSIAFMSCAVFAFRSANVPLGAKRGAALGCVFLVLQILAGGLTVLLLVKAIVVTMHLMLATFFFLSVLWMNFAVTKKPAKALESAPEALRWIITLPLAVLVQIFIGGLVASTYAGSVCVDWPLCNGQWVPTWTGVIGLQILHRLVAYTLAVAIPALAFAFWRLRGRAWMTSQFLGLLMWAAALVFVQVGIGIANLLYYIPPRLTVLHQTVAIVLLAFSVRIWFVSRSLFSAPAENRVGDRVPPSQTPQSSLQPS